MQKRALTLNVKARPDVLALSDGWEPDVAGRDESSIVDIIVPVHNQRELVENCLASVLDAQNHTSFELVVIDDASTDAALRAHLISLSYAGHITLLTNDRNQGFTSSVNRGMRVHPGRDVVLLNSDTLVFHDWIDRLRRAAYSHHRVATANPMTNGSPISSYPFRQADGHVSFEISDAELDKLAAETNTGRYVDVHYAVGFCIYIRRDVLDDIGYFDSIHFPVGYGEEADFCYRARRVGWRHVVTGDTFVRHWEGQSFGARKLKLMSEMFDNFIRLHPDVIDNDRSFEMRDPLRSLRESLDIARLKRMLPSNNHLDCFKSSDVEKTGALGLLFNVDGNLVRLVAPQSKSLATLPEYRLPADVAALNTALDRLSITTLRFQGRGAMDDFANMVRGRPIDLGLRLKLELAEAIT